MKHKCPICKKKVVGRSDKKFCSVICKSEYHRKLRSATNKVTDDIDKILHRNRSILLELMGKKKDRLTISRSDLDEKKFNFNFITSYYINSKGKTYKHIYDFTYMVFSEDKIMINRLQKYGANTFAKVRSKSK